MRNICFFAVQLSQSKKNARLKALAMAAPIGGVTQGPPYKKVIFTNIGIFNIPIRGHLFLFFGVLLGSDQSRSIGKVLWLPIVYDTRLVPDYGNVIQNQ
ncbi:MAG: hypothetical protein CR994_03635 [Maribacter sp.]|nr:MAG: hypothetical protein CR994_03635 [Maribacter sp.]